MANTINYNIELPTVGADLDTWGDINNAAIVATDAQMKLNDDGATDAFTLATVAKAGAEAADAKAVVADAKAVAADVKAQSALDGTPVSATAIEYWTGAAGVMATPAIIELANAQQYKPSGATQTFDLHAGINFNVDVNQDVTFNNFTNATEGRSGYIWTMQSGGPHTLTWGSNFVFPNTAPLLLSGASSTSEDVFFYLVLNPNFVLITRAGGIY